MAGYGAHKSGEASSLAETRLTRPYGPATRLSVRDAHPTQLRLHIVNVEHDPRKNAQNRAKHGVDFEDAHLVLYDPDALVLEDVSSVSEQRFIAVGMDALGRVLTLSTPTASRTQSG